MGKFIIKKIFLVKCLICTVFSGLIYLSFRIDLIYKNDVNILISFIIIQFIIWSILFFSKRKFISNISYNLFIIVFLNLLLTPLFHLITFDVPTRQPNYKIMREYNGGFFEGMFFGKHFISSDEKGYRTNKKIDYVNKNENTLRIVTVGASTTEQGITDDDKTWSSLLGANLEEVTDKNIEVINTGVAGLRAVHHYITLKRIKKYKPDVVIFMMGINDWNDHIVDSDKKYFIPIYEIKYNFKKSILFKTFRNINKQIHRKIINKRSTGNGKIANNPNPELNPEAYLLPQINSLYKRKIIKKFRPRDVSKDYQYWLNLIINECKKKDPICLFLDQPTAYKKNISSKLKKRLWMTPPNQDYTLSLDDLISISTVYNSWLKQKVTDNKLNFCLLSNKIEANTSDLIDDCHFSENGAKKVSDVLTRCITLSLKSILN